MIALSDASVRAARFWERAVRSRAWPIGAAYLALYLLLDRASYVQPLAHTSITPWNPNTGVAMALLLTQGVRWTVLVAGSILTGELLVDAVTPAWPVLALTSTYLAVVYASTAWALRRRGLGGPIETPRAAAWFVGVVAVATGIAAAGYVELLSSAGELDRTEAWAAIAHYWIGEFSGIIVLTPLALTRIDVAALRERLRHNRRELFLQALGAVAGVTLAFALAAARDGRLFYPLFAPVAWVALRHGVPGAMLSAALVQAGLVAALELTPGSIPLFDVQFPLLALSLTALLLGALATERDAALRRVREQDAALERSTRFAVVGQLASALTHELNQPMTALLSYVRAAELMSEGHAGADERLSTTLHKAGAEAARAAAVLRRLRGFYRGEGVRLERADALAVCAHVAHALQDRMRRNGVEFELRRRTRLPRVLFDRTQLEIVMHNLLTNCLDAFESEPAERRQTRLIEVTGEAQGADVLISVEDSGPGISPELRARLFEPFATSKTTGMGLGLSLCRSLLRHQGGDLWSEPSRLGGARFVIRLGTRPRPLVSL